MLEAFLNTDSLFNRRRGITHPCHDNANAALSRNACNFVSYWLEEQLSLGKSLRGFHSPTTSVIEDELMFSAYWFVLYGVGRSDPRTIKLELTQTQTMADSFERIDEVILILVAILKRIRRFGALPFLTSESISLISNKLKEHRPCCTYTAVALTLSIRSKNSRNIIGNRAKSYDTRDTKQRGQTFVRAPLSICASTELPR
jgi:hypothetical protein